MPILEHECDPRVAVSFTDQANNPERVFSAPTEVVGDNIVDNAGGNTINGTAGADRILKELSDGPSRVRVGLIVKEGAPAREGAEIADADGAVIGKVTSGGPSPTLGKNIAMGYVPPAHATLGTALKVIVRGKAAAAEVVAMPFVAQRYYRKPKA